MAEIKNQRPRRKFGLGDLFVLILLVIVVAGIIIGATQTNNKVCGLVGFLPVLYTKRSLK